MLIRVEKQVSRTFGEIKISTAFQRAVSEALRLCVPWLRCPALQIDPRCVTEGNTYWVSQVNAHSVHWEPSVRTAQSHHVALFVQHAVAQWLGCCWTWLQLSGLFSLWSRSSISKAILLYLTQLDERNLVPSTAECRKMSFYPHSHWIQFFEILWIHVQPGRSAKFFKDPDGSVDLGEWWFLWGGVGFCLHCLTGQNSQFSFSLEVTRVRNSNLHIILESILFREDILIKDI